MWTFLLTLALTLAVVVLFGAVINHCRRRLRKTPHGLSGMCQRDGGRLCASCAREVVRSSPGGQGQ